MVTVLSEIASAHGGTSHVTIHDLPIPGNIVWYVAEIALPSGAHLEWRFGYTHHHARTKADVGHVITPETFTRFIREIVTQRLQHEPLRDYPDLVFGENRPLPPRAFGLPDDDVPDYTDPVFDTPLSQGMAEEYYGMLSGYGTPWTLEDFRNFRDEVSREGEQEMDEEDSEVTSGDG